MSPELQFRTEAAHDTEDLALTFMEQEIGRHDWKNNWEKVKAKGDVLIRIQNWLDALRVKHDPQSILDYLDQLGKERAGRWA